MTSHVFWWSMRAGDLFVGNHFLVVIGLCVAISVPPDLYKTHQELPHLHICPSYFQLKNLPFLVLHSLTSLLVPRQLFLPLAGSIKRRDLSKAKNLASTAGSPSLVVPFLIVGPLPASLVISGTFGVPVCRSAPSSGNLLSLFFWWLVRVFPGYGLL